MTLARSLVGTRREMEPIANAPTITHFLVITIIVEGTTPHSQLAS